MPVRNSSWRPAPASAASFGSNAACTAWNRRIGMRATKMPVMNPASASFCAWVLARIVAARNAAYDRLCASTELRSRRPNAPDNSVYGAVGPGVRSPFCPRSEINTAAAGGQRECEAVHAGRVAVEGEEQPHARMRTVPSEPCIRPYAPNRPLPESVPRVMNAAK